MDCRLVAAGVDWRNSIPLRWRIAVARAALHQLARPIRHAITRVEPRIVASRWIESRSLHRGFQRRARIHLGIACRVVSRLGAGLGVDLGIMGEQKITQRAALDCCASGIERRGGVALACARGEFGKFAGRISRTCRQCVVDKLRQAKPETFRELERRGSDRSHDVAGCGVARANCGR